MRILVTSDSHGRKSNFFDAVEMHINDTDLFVNLGDNNSGKDLEDAEIYFRNKLRLKAVSGNCDFSSNNPFCEIFNFAGKKVLMCHGHTFYVKHVLEMKIDFTDNAIKELAKEGFDKVYGARPLRRTIQQKIEDPLSELMLENKFVAGKSCTVDFADDEFKFNIA